MLKSSPEKVDSLCNCHTYILYLATIKFMEDRVLWRHRWLSSINELTSLAVQQASWLDKSNTNPHWSFIEFWECYFDDAVGGEDYTDLVNLGWVSQEEYDIIKVWHNTLHAYRSPANDDYDHKAILQDPQWIEIVNLGEIAKKKLIAALSTDEKKVLSEKIDYTAYL